MLTPLDCGQLEKEGMRGQEDTVEIEIVEGAQAGDFLWNGLGLVVVSPRVLEIWKEYAALTTYPVQVATYGKVNYIGAAFTGRAGRFDAARSRAKFFDDGSGARPAIMHMEGLYFDESEWDGSDLMTVDEFPCVSIVAERVKIEMEQRRITNCKYIPLEDYGKIKIPRV